MKTIAMRIVVVLVALSVCLAPVAWAAEKTGNENPASDIGLGVASFLCTVPYGAAKVAMALLGGIVGGFTYVLSGFDRRAADAVWYTTIEGDYVVTPDHLRGKKDLRFTGVPPEKPSSGR
jgi:hypothetical protein